MRSVRIFQILLLILCGCTKQPQSIDEPPTSSSKGPGPVAMSIGDDTVKTVMSLPLRIVWASGTEYTYTTALHSEMKAANGMRMLQIDLQCDLVVSPAQVENNTQLMQVRLQSLELAIAGEGAADAEKTAGLKNELMVRVWGKWNNGVVETLYFPERSTPFAVGIWRTVLTTLQVQTGGRAVEAGVQNEFDANGEYVVEYRQMANPDAAGDRWSKTKRRYVKGLFEGDPTLNTMGAPSPALVSSKGSFTVADGVIQMLSAEDSVKYAISGQGTLLGATKAEFALQKSAPATTPFVNPGSTVLALAAGEPFDAPLPKGAMDAARMEGLTFDDVLAALVARAKDPRRQHLVSKQNDEVAEEKSQDAGKAWTSEWSRSFSALPAFFRQQPATVKRAEKEILAGSLATRSLLGGLAAAGTDETQGVLLRLVDNAKVGEAVRESAVRNIIQCRDPGPAVVGFVESLQSHPVFSRYAPFGMGTVSRKLRQSGNEGEAARLVRILLNQLYAAGDKTVSMDVLMGIANSGHPLAFDAVQPLLESTSESERAMAVEAIRLMPVEEVNEILVRFMDSKNEPSAKVRFAAVQSAAVRNLALNLKEGLFFAAEHDTDSQVRKAARSSLFNWMDQDPSIRSRLNLLAGDASL